jgi:aryl-alcohol dehydrogenase-like predicted oxidoreductase
MERRRLGSTGLSVPVVGMGTWRTFDVRGSQAEEHARAIVDAALAAGAGFFDSSPMYGEAERVLAGALQPRRESAVVATKVWARSLPEGQRQIDRALTFFGGHVELYQISTSSIGRDTCLSWRLCYTRGKSAPLGPPTTIRALSTVWRP